MKKHLISFFFALVLSIMLFCVSASATEAETTKAEKWFNEHHAVTGMVTDMTINYGDSSVTERVYSKDGKEATEVEINGRMLRLISDSKDVIMFYPDMPLFHVKFPGMAEIMMGLIGEVPTEFTLDFVKSYEVTEGDKTYYVEEFIDANGNIGKYYFLGDELIFLEVVVESGGETGTSRSEIVSYEVDDEIFEIPWYSINLYPLVMIVALFSLGSLI